MLAILVGEIRRSMRLRDAFSVRMLDAMRVIDSNLLVEHDLPQYALPFSWLNASKVPALVYELVTDEPRGGDGCIGSDGKRRSACFSCHRYIVDAWDDAGSFKPPADARRLCEQHVGHLLAARDLLAHLTRIGFEPLDRIAQLANTAYLEASDSNMLVVDLAN
jgi:hypothetical protein